MLRELKCLVWALLLIATAISASAFSLYGPLTAEAWQTQPIGYQELAADDYGIDVGTPRKITEEYRWNTPILYYAYDPSFEIFGSNAMAAVDQAMAILNGLTNASAYSAQLSEVPLDTSRGNSRAAALNLLDLKSVTLSLLLEELGLASAERWTWALHDRAGPAAGATCPFGMSYAVTKFNFDPVTFIQSSYVNEALFSYRINERCQPPPGENVIADAYEFPVDPVASSTAVAGAGIFGGVGRTIGSFFTGLTRDDVGGLRYLLRTNNMNTETVDASATLVGSAGTSTSFLLPLTTLDLALFVQTSLTNNPAQLQALYPDLLITSFTVSFEVVAVTNTVAFFVNEPYSSPFAPATLQISSFTTFNFQTNYHYVFGNVYTNSYYTNGIVTILTTNATLSPFANPGSVPVPNVSSQRKKANFINGDFLIIPTNVCEFEVVSNLVTQVFPVEVSTVVATNGTATNIAGQSFSQTTIRYFTNHIVLARETLCATNATGVGGIATPALRQGIEKITFIRKDFDSLLGQTWTPVTTNYTVNSVVGGQVVAERFQRTTSQPDILFTVSDQAGTPTDNVLTYSMAGRSTPNYLRAGVTNNVAGPGIIQAAATIIYNNVGAIFENDGPFFVDESSQTPNFFQRWGSYDGTTNAPIVYPDGTSLQNLENQVLMQITPSSLPEGTVGVPYGVQLGVVGGQYPYTFSRPPGSPGLPPGLTLSAGGLISGSPQFDDTYDFVVRVTDSGQRQVDAQFTIIISQ